MTQHVQDKGKLKQRRANLKKRRDSPAPIARDSISAKDNGGSNDLPDEIGHVEERGQDGTFFRVGQFADKRGAGDDTSGNAEAENHAGDDVHADC